MTEKIDQIIQLLKSINSKLGQENKSEIKKTYPGVKNKSKKPPAVDSYIVRWIKTSDSGKAQQIKYDEFEFWLPNGCIKSEFKKVPEEQTMTIQKWIIAEKLKEAKEEL